MAPLQTIWLWDGSLTLWLIHIHSISWRAAPLPSTPLPLWKVCKGHQLALSSDLLLTPSRPVKLSLVLSSLVFASTHWYCGLLIFSLTNLSHTSDLLRVISYTRYTHIHWVISSYYMSIHIQYIFQRRSAQLHLISSSAILFSCPSGGLLITPSVFISHQLSASYIIELLLWLSCRCSRPYLPVIIQYNIVKEEVHSNQHSRFHDRDSIPGLSYNI